MKNRVLLKSALLLLLIAADGLVTASEDDDLIFDPEGKQTAVQAPLIETRQDNSLFHRIKRGFRDLFTLSSTTTTTSTPTPSGQKEDGETQNQHIDKSVILNDGERNFTLDQPEVPSAETSIGGIERLTLEKDEDNDEADDELENEINNHAESQRIPITYGNSDDEDLAGSGEIEGSAGEVDYHPNAGNQPRNTDGKARFYRVTLTVGEPYRREYSDRSSLEYRELSGNLTHAIQNLYNRHIPGYDHFASVVKISPTSDAFTSQVTLDIGSTFTDELEVRAILEQQLQYHSLGSIQVGPEGFTFRIFQAGEKDAQPECDQTAELSCRSGECVPLESRCDGVLQCNDGSDEADCPQDSFNRTRDDFEYSTVPPRATYFPVDSNSQPEVNPEAPDIDRENEQSTLRSTTNKCRADDTVRCHDGSRYICSVQQCDGVPDCDDGGDEVDCPHPGCSAGEFACDVNRCILESQRCNFVKDCQDGSDEHDCNYPACSPAEFICRSGQCIDRNKYCNNVEDCHDGSDEQNCPCKEDQFECSPGYCVFLSRRCDGYMDCSNGRDEQNCHNMTRCRADEFECASGSCVSKNARCDGRNDCPDHSDEYNCNVTTCSGDQYRCLDGICLSIDKRCNGITDCRNGEDEVLCGCGEAEFSCTDGRCISYVLQCNGVNECSDGSDERDCETYPWRKFYNAGKFAIARKSPAAISYGGKLAERRRNMNMQPATTGSAYRLAIKPAVTIGNPILEAFPEEAQRRRFPNSMLQSRSADLIKIAPKSKNNNSLSQRQYVEHGRARKPDANCGTPNAEARHLTGDQVLSKLNYESQVSKPFKLSDNLVKSFRTFKQNNISLKNVHLPHVNNRNRTRDIISGGKYLSQLVTSSTMKMSIEPAAAERNALRNITSKNSDATSLNYVRTENDKLDNEETFFGYKMKKDSKVANYYNKYLKRTLLKKIAPVTASTSKIEEHVTTNMKYDKVQQQVSSASKEMSTTIKSNNNYSLIKTEKLLYTVNSPKVEIHRYFPVIINAVDDVDTVSNLSITNDNETRQNQDNENKKYNQSNAIFQKLYESNENSITQDDNDIDSRMINFTEERKSIPADDRAYAKESQESRETLESSEDDFEVLILNLTTTRAPEIVTRDANKSAEKGSTEKHGKREHKSRHNGRKNNRPRKRKKNRDAKRKRKQTSTVVWEVDEPTSVDYGGIYSSERAKTTLPRNDPGYDKADGNRNTSMGRNDWHLTDEITTEPFKTEFSNADESVSENPAGDGTRNGFQFSEETTNVDHTTGSTASNLSTTASEKKSKKCKTPVTTTTPTTTTEISWLNWFLKCNNTNKDEETECEDVATFSNASELIGNETDNYGVTVSDGDSSTYDVITESDSTASSWDISTEENTEISNIITAEYSTIDNEESDESNTQPWNRESVTYSAIVGTTYDINSNFNYEEEKEEDVTEKLLSDEDNEIDNDVAEDYEIDGCNDTQHACDRYLCIEGDRVCDGIVDCLNANDETNCDYIYLKRLEEHFTPNKHVEVIPLNTVKDYSSFDECNVNEHPCDGTCISALNVCNGERDCLDGTDEDNCAEDCPVGEQPCDNGVCINKNFFCDRNIDCHDGSDEQNCPDSGETNGVGQECHHDSFICSDRTCIPRAAVCDGHADCPRDEDEINCHRGCTRDQFQCANGECIRTDQKCNGYIECADGSDEEECEPPEPPPGHCAADQYMCISDRRCVPISSICNGIPECRDGSDEHNCDTDPTSKLKLKTYPSEQVIKESREVVFQCRDEGLLRARVRWIRGNGLPLPPGSRDNNGRLEIPNIQLDHAGTYVCEAVGYPPATPGRQVTVVLSVEKFEMPATRPPKVCQFDQATCSNGNCIPKSYVCDGKFDCTDGSDEMRCSPHGCEPNEFRCNNKECISKVWRCDGDKDCADNSDEENCTPSPPGSVCSYTEFACSTNNSPGSIPCIPKSFHCDMERDCIDGSDEIGCSPVYITKPPPPMVVLVPGDLLVLTCTAIGVPTPEINWRLNWGHIPEKCTTKSINGTGTLTCPNIQTEDQGAYSCEGLNGAGFVFAVPDAILVVKDRGNVCPKGKFNSEAKAAEECISCFCFGVATECRSADLFTYQFPPPFDRPKIVSVEIVPTIKILGDINNQISQIRPIGRDGVQLLESFINDLDAYKVPYFALPENYHGSQLKSYGGYLKYTIRHSGNGTPNHAPSVILSGNNYILIHRGKEPAPDYETERSVRFFYGDWYKQQGRSEVLASREEIMMTLANVDNIVIKVKYEDSPQLDVRLTNIIMDTADVRNTGLGSASFVEECQCPTGYSGLSCEHCAPGYLRRESGPWLGQCYRDEPPCLPGYYGDPSRNIPCQVCPCPLTNPSNQFARTCHLGSDGQPTCDCPPGYVGRRCEQCAAGYQGNPLIPGDMCVALQQCDPNGSLSPNADPYTGKCHCKEYATGLTCNQCKANTFNLAAANQFGCIACFCMGITNRCISSNWYRNEIRVSFTNSIRGFSLIESKSTDTPDIVEGIHLNTISREIDYREFPNRGNNDVYYWQLPSIFLGDQIASYGGNLKYTVRYVPSPGGQSSKNNAADVELISANDINLLYYSRESLEPNSQQSFTVPLLEQFWQRNDGTQADREHLLMALADVRAIRIKATYTTHTDEAALSFVSLDTAEKYNTGKARAVEVEECSCPAGYRGLSCEDCDVGYTRAIEGLYLGICEPCNCNNHSSQCDPETGTCENCAHHTTGEFCEECEPGYEGDATRGKSNDCTYRNQNPEPCRCNAAGSRSLSCVDGRCECKRNVEGPECNRCRLSTYGLRTENIDGCIECYCSGVTDQCHESTLDVQQIPMWVYDSHHGFTLTDSTRRDVIDDGFELNVAMNEIGYRYPDSRSHRLFWSLPSVFTGNKVKSYGGNLTLTQHITAYPGAQSYKDQDILLIGNGITLFWTNPVELQPEIPLTYSVPLKEHEWRRLTTEGPRSASRTDLMIVLSNLEAILVRASHSERMTATYISDISMDTAEENVIGNRATQVEACRCPTGYSGTSCEVCSRGYYRDTSDRTVSYLGACNLCPCNKNEESCEIDRSGQIKCHCLPGYSGQYCQDSGTVDRTTTPSPPYPPRIVVYVQEPEFQIVHTGNIVRYHCTGRSKDTNSVHIKWEKEGGQLPRDRSVDDGGGLLVIRDVKVSDSGIYVCQVSDGINIGYKKVTLTVGGANPVEPKVNITPSYQQVREGEPVEFRCEVTGNPPPQLDWVRIHGNMSPEASFDNGVWTLPAASKNDAAEYKCVATNNVGIDEKTTILYVQDNPSRPPPQVIPPTITPLEWTGTIGDVVKLTCTPSQYAANVTWTRSGGLPLPYTATQRDGILTIINPTSSDSGIYVCTATSIRGTETSTTARITIVPRRETPTVKVRPERQEVLQGTVAEVRCITNEELRGLYAKWSKYTETMSSRVQQVGDTLRITNVQVSDRGVYICRVTGPTGTFEASAIIEVEPREAPIIVLYPQDIQTVLLGGSADLQCRAKAGFPVPELHWSRQDKRPFASNIEQLPGGLLRLSNITINDGGAYICSASNEVGSTSAVAHIEVQSMPVITITPQHGILPVKRGSQVRLMCSASGHPQPNVAWSKHVNGITIHDTYSRKAATPLSAVYEIFSVSSDDEGSYTCQATNIVGIAEERIQIRIEDDDDVPCTGDRGDIPCDDRQHPEIDPRDPNQTGGVLIPKDYLRIPNGGKVEMRCQVFGPDGDHIFLDWKRSDHRALPEGSTVLNGVLSIPTVDRNSAGEYICLGLDPAGTVLFRAKSHLEIISPPRIELNPTRQTVGPGENPSIICSATGDEPLHIEWEAIGRPLPHSVSHSGGTLQFHGITYSDAGKYVCKATNTAGTAEAVAEVLVNEHPYDSAEIRAEQRDVTTYVGYSVRLRCEMREHAMIHWSREGQPLPANARIGEDYLELTQVKLEDSGRYICQVQTNHGVSSDYINFNVSPTAMSLISIEVSQDPINIGDTVDIHCTYTGPHGPRYRWTRPNHVSLPINAQEYNNVLRLNNVAVSDSGPYRCIVDTPEGILEKDFNLIVHGGILDEPAIETKLAPYGSSLEMDCRLDLDPPIQFQWHKLGGLLPNDSQTYENKLNLVNVKADDAGTYICVGNNGESRVEVPTVLVVTGVVPNFSQAPESFISFPPLPDSYLKFNIEISFKPESYDGILLYNDESAQGHGDFIILSLNNGYPQFKFDLGSGPAVIRADKPVTLSEWHTIKIQRNRKEGTMLVDGEGPYKVLALGRRQGLDLKEPLYIGGIPQNSRINKQAEASTGFVGCISRLVLGEKQVDLVGDQTYSVGITTCETCAENPCNNGGVCQEAAMKNGYTCLCRAGFSGKHCDNVGQSCYPGACGEGSCVDKEVGFDCYCPIGKTGSRCEHSVNIYDPSFHDDRAFIAHETPKALRRERESSTTTHSRSRLRNAQVRKPRSRLHHHNNLHHTKH